MRIGGKELVFNSNEFKLLFEQLFPVMASFATRILGDEEKGKDIAQEAFVKLWIHDQEEFDDLQSLKAYLYVLVKNACISALRKERKFQSTDLKEALPVQDQLFLDEILREETYRLLYEAIENLSPQASKLMKLALLGHSNQEISDMLNISLNSVKTVKKRAYKTLKEKLGYQFVNFLLLHFLDLL